MIQEKPAWAYRSENGLNQAYGNVEMHNGRALGQWFCADTKSGDLLWEKEMDIPNTISGVAGNVIIATRTHSGGPWTADFGIYGVSLDTGEVLWKADGVEPMVGFFARLFYRLGLFKDEDSPSHVTANQVHCMSGRMLNPQDGQRLSNIDNDEEHEIVCEQEKRAQSLFDENIVSVDELGEFLVSRILPGKHKSQDFERLAIYGFNIDHQLTWTFDCSDLGYSAFYNFYTYRLHGENIYFVGKTVDRNSPPQAEGEDEQPSIYHLLTLNARSGEVTQVFRLEEDAIEYRIESINEEGILISHSNSYLALHRFQENI